VDSPQGKHLKKTHIPSYYLLLLLLLLFFFFSTSSFFSSSSYLFFFSSSSSSFFFFFFFSSSSSFFVFFFFVSFIFSDYALWIQKPLHQWTVSNKCRYVRPAAFITITVLLRRNVLRQLC
jgi:hypothetical protein